MATVDWRGVFPALTTKFTADDALDFDAMGRHLEFQLEAGVHGIIILGSLGGNSTLSFEEKLAMIRFFAGALDGRAPRLELDREDAGRVEAIVAEVLGTRPEF